MTSGDIPMAQRRHIFDHFELQMFMTLEEFMQHLDDCCVQGTFLWFCCGKCYVVEYIMGEPERWRADLLGNFLSLKEILERNLGKKSDQKGVKI